MAQIRLTSPPSKTFSVAMWILGLLLVGQIIFIVHSLVSRMDLKNPPLAAGSPFGSVDTSNMSEDEILEHEARILDALKMPPSKVPT